MSDKLDLQTPDLVNQNIQKIAALFPNCITETAEGKAIDFDLLRQELNHEIVEGSKERYRLEWPGKREAIVTANLPTTKTLRPVPEESVNFDTTENLYIEGDNLEVLKLLQESYLGKIKMIYIDPPYNTGNDFVYKDNFAQDTEEFKAESGLTDELGNRLVANPETSGRYHSDWLTMMYPRLKLARNLLTDDGVIFISIDDNEVYNLRKVCDEVFGEVNYRGTIVRATGTRMGSGNKEISSEIDYVLIFSKDDLFQFSPLPMSMEDLKIYDQEDENGKYLTRSLRRTGGENRREDRPTMFYPIIAPDGTEILPIAPAGWESRWICGIETFKSLVQNKQIEWKKVKNEEGEKWQVYQKHYIGDAVKYASNLWGDIDGNKKATREVNDLFDGMKYFEHPKPVTFLKRIFEISSLGNSDIVLDFFSGSATTAHAVMQLNADTSTSSLPGKRKFIMVQLPEKTDEKSEAWKAGYKNICEIGKERIRRAAKKIQDELVAKAKPAPEKTLFDDNSQPETQNSQPDFGFRVYRLDTSNMQDVYYRPQDYKPETIDMFADNIKTDRTSHDLLAQVMLDWGLPLSYRIEELRIAGKQVFMVAQNSLMACFDNGINEAFAKELATHKPLRVVFRDRSFATDTAKENVKQLLKQLSPETEMRVI